MNEVLIGPGLRHLDEVVTGEFGPAHDLIDSLLVDEWKAQALATRSYLSGNYYRDIHKSGHQIISDVGYGAIIEWIGWTTQPGRFPAEKAIAAAGPDIEKILSDAASRVIDRIENG